MNVLLLALERQAAKSLPLLQVDDSEVRLKETLVEKVF